MSTDYSDPRIKIGPDGLVISGYYIPWGTKKIQFDAIRSVRRVNMGWLTGRIRLWGTANPGYWANLDVKRPTKRVAFIVHTGKSIGSFLTPDDPDAFESALRARVHVPIARGGRGTII
jgi:Bacterial PH domain